MTCIECADALLLLADREAGLTLSATEQREAQAAELHAALCPECRSELALVREATALFTALPTPGPSPAFDARVLAAFFAEQAMHAPVAVVTDSADGLSLHHMPRWLKRVAVGYAAGWGTVAAATAVWMLAGGWRTAIEAVASVTGPALTAVAAGMQHSVEFIASLVVALQLADRVIEVVAPAMIAVGRALQPSPFMTMMLVSLAGAAGVLALLTQLPRITRRRTRHVQAILWTA